MFATSTLQSSSKQAEEINRLTNYFFLAAGFMLLIVVALTTFILIKYRYREGRGVAMKQPDKKWEIAMIGIPTALVAVFLYMSIATMRNVLPDAAGKKPDVIVTGHQWWWQAQYPASNAVAANEIHLPVGRSVLVQLLSADVIHDWWIPELGNKMDLVPGQQNYLWLTIKKPGVYIGACSEFCGAQHAGMRLRVIAQSEQDYNNWIAAQQQPAVTVNDTLLQRGAQLFSQYTCGGCHRINGTEARGQTGPDLTHIGSRTTLLAGIMTNNPHNLKSWLRHPQQLKPGAYMPEFYLDETSLHALTAYLTSLH